MYRYTCEQLAVVRLHAPMQPYSVLPRLKNYFHSYEKALQAGSKGWLRAGIAAKYVDAINEYEFAYENNIKLSQQLSIDILFPHDLTYPNLLKHLYDCPAVLYVRGDLSLVNEELSDKVQLISIVGSRSHTSYGLRVAQELAQHCVMLGVTTVSGLALGIDGAVHRATAQAGGRTIGILGCGVDRIYPSSHVNLAKDILAKGGAIISEFPLQTPPLPYHFPRRNRLIAGISPLTVVVEGLKSGGAMLTARLANENGRDVLAVVGDIYRTSSEGPNSLIEEGATPLCAVQDLSSYYRRSGSNLYKKSENSEIAEMRRVAQAFARQGTHIDIVAQRVQLDIATLSSKVILMELQGWIRHDGGGVYRRVL